MKKDMLADRTEIEKSLSIENYFPPFFSVLLPELGRPHYLKKCLDSIISKADMPVEIIVHDDASDDEKQGIIFNELKHQISTLIFNTSWNVGLGMAMNRCRSMASSDYMLAMNTDLQWTSSFLKNMKAALDLPYVGIVNVVPSINPGTGVHITSNGIKISLIQGIGSTTLLGIRRNVWDEVGGWGEKVQTTASDGGFVGNVFGRGYFVVAVEGTYINEMWKTSPDGKGNIGEANPDYVSAARFTRHDNNVPKLFGMPTAKHFDACNKRREDIWHLLNDEIAKDMFYRTWYNSHFACNQSASMFNGGGIGGIDWDFVKRYGHDQWKDRIIKDFNLC